MITDHIVFNTRTGRVECVYCKREEGLPSPIPIRRLSAWLDSFTAEHQECERPVHWKDLDEAIERAKQ